MCTPTIDRADARSLPQPAPNMCCIHRPMSRFDALCEQVASALCHDVVSELGVYDAMVDGEVIATDESGRPQFYDLLRRTRSPSYIAFDLLWLNGTDLRALTSECHSRLAPVGKQEPPRAPLRCSSRARKSTNVNQRTAFTQF
jgi:hypothetical protein